MANMIAQRQLALLVMKKNAQVLPARFAHAATPAKRKYERWQDVPDHLIPTTSKRDPDNEIYSHPNYIKYRKNQIFFQQDDGVPIYFKRGLRSKILFYSLFGLFVGGIGVSYYYIFTNLVYPPKKKSE